MMVWNVLIQIYLSEIYKIFQRDRSMQCAFQEISEI